VRVSAPRRLGRRGLIFIATSHSNVTYSSPRRRAAETTRGQYFAGIESRKRITWTVGYGARRSDASVAMDVRPSSAGHDPIKSAKLLATELTMFTITTHQCLTRQCLTHLTRRYNPSYGHTSVPTPESQIGPGIRERERSCACSWSSDPYLYRPRKRLSGVWPRHSAALCESVRRVCVLLAATS
jgi:hypothetical protein